MMNRRTLLSLTTTAVIGFGVALLASTGSGQAQQSDTDKIKATIDAFHAALTALDIRKMDDVWGHDPYVTVINPRDKTISIGWDAVRKAFQEGVFSFWNELKVTQRDAPVIHVSGGTAWANGTTVAAGKPKSGGDVNAPTFETGILEKRGDRWLIVSWSAWRVPQ
jgi:ketosteroid isomerase-like protein